METLDNVPAVAGIRWSRDPHQVYSSCLGLEHAQQAIYAPSSYQHCAVFTLKTLHRRLARQVSLSDNDPYLPIGDLAVEPAVEEEVNLLEAVPAASTDWSSQSYLALALPRDEDVLDLDYGDDEDETLDILISEDDDDKDLFAPRAAQCLCRSRGWK
ncbi:hypothetical protein JOB18_026061 [Solea senegalensis]|uniref:Uncharacterized protein n=1 Tax=Solea senegalensis TaxID=28829 RepID=A0AAV6QUU5_SOLSE|nr:hypothetical protein JOB18_026061 [Solea senegalensis]